MKKSLEKFITWGSVALIGFILFEATRENLKPREEPKPCYEIGLPFNKGCMSAVNDSVIDKSNNTITYRMGGGWKNSTFYIKTRNDTVLSVKVVYPKY